MVMMMMMMLMMNIGSQAHLDKPVGVILNADSINIDVDRQTD